MDSWCSELGLHHLGSRSTSRWTVHPRILYQVCDVRGELGCRFRCEDTNVGFMNEQPHGYHEWYLELYPILVK